MSLMSQSLLEEAEHLRLVGRPNEAIHALRAVLSQCETDLRRSSDGENLPHSLTTILRLRQVAAFQLALLLLQSTDDASGVSRREEADELLWKLGFRMRLSSEALAYDLDHFRRHMRRSDGLRKRMRTSAGSGSCVDRRESEPPSCHPPVVVLDEALSPPLFAALQHSLRPSSRYWSDHLDGRDGVGFFSYNVRLPSVFGAPPPPASNLFEQAAISVRSVVAPFFPSVWAASSCEVWCHSRPGDGHHQLHYDLDEGKLRAGGEVWCPIISCVLTLGTISDEYAGAPTLVCERSILRTNDNANQTDGGRGWLCYPRLNRLVCFEGSLLHGVMPGIVRGDAEEDDSADDFEEKRARVTLMIGFWKKGVQTMEASADKSSEYSATTRLNLGPNMILPNVQLSKDILPWVVDELQPLDEEDQCKTSILQSSPTDVSKTAALVRPLWRLLDLDDLRHGDFIRKCDPVLFKGRFFLRTDSLSEIDTEIRDVFAAAK